MVRGDAVFEVEMALFQPAWCIGTYLGEPISSQPDIFRAFNGKVHIVVKEGLG